jgi:uncharacterized protein (TIGR03000 family)
VGGWSHVGHVGGWNHVGYSGYHGGWAGYGNRGWVGYGHRGWGYPGYWGGYNPWLYSGYYAAPYYGYSMPYYDYSTPYYDYSTPYNDYSMPYYDDTWNPTYGAPGIPMKPGAYQSYSPSAPAVPTANTAVVQVILPFPRADVWFNDVQTDQTGTTRQFVTPPLTPGQTYTYDVRATWMVNGQPVTQARQVTVEAGKTSVVSFVE